MRNDYPETRTKSTVARSSTARGGRISQKELVDAHDASFGTLVDDVSQKTGLPGDEVLYHDPLGFRTNGDPVDLRTKMYDRVWSDAFAKFNDEIRNGASVWKAAQTVSKAVGRSSFSLPIFVAPEVTITDQRQTPTADMVARTAIQEDTYRVDEQTDTGDSAQYNEPGSAGGTRETWPENDDTYDTHTYSVVAYGRQTAVTDFLQLSAQTLRSSQAITEDALIRSQRFYEENQALRGTGTATGFSGNDPNGFDGLPDLVRSEANQFDDRTGAGAAKVDWVRDNIRSLRRSGAAYDDIVTVTDHTSFDQIKDDVDDVLRYQSPGDSIDFGFQALNIDGTPVLESHGVPNVDGDRFVVTVDMSEIVMAMLQDATLHPLARTSPEEDIAVDSYGTLASSSTERIEVDHSIGA
jgi:hypothetical protein